jgi:lauroyl/myristoyl acyltransferase
MPPRGYLHQKDLSCFLQMPVNTYLAAITPLALFRRMIHCMGFAYYAVNHREAAAISASVNQNLSKLSESRSEGLALKTFVGIFDHYFEKLVNAHRSMQRMIAYFDQHIDIPDRRWIDPLRESGRGGLLVTGHFGAVEYLPLFLASKGYRPSIVMRFKTQKLREVLNEKSRYVDLELIDADRGNVAYQAIDAVKRGRILITLCDEFKHWRPSRNNTISIFGRHAPRDRTLDVLYRRTRAPVFLGLMRRRKSRFALDIHFIADGHDPVSVTDRAWEILSRYILRYPQQWYQWKEFEAEFEAYAAGRALYAPV